MTQSDATYRIERRFDAPRDLVWRAWTDPALLAEWYGPGVETKLHTLDVNPGGLWLTEMKMGGNGHFERTQYLDVQPPERLVWLQSMANDQFEVIANPMMDTWPRVLRGEVILSDEGAKTLMTFSWTPHDASAEEIATFAQAMSGAARGWNSGFDMIETLLRDLVA